MRDPERIGRITWKLAQLWQLQSDMRFGQLLENYIYPFGEVDWHEEEDRLERKIDKAILKVSNQLEKQGVGKTARKI
jgi:hypothetical protein